MRGPLVALSVAAHPWAACLVVAISSFILRL
jgi:hypothetical protein